MLRRATVRRHLARSLLLAGGMAAMGSGLAQGRTKLTVTAPVEIEHDSNPGMTVRRSGSTTWLRAHPGVAAVHVVGDEEFHLDAALTAERSSNPQAAKDRLDPRIRTAWKHEGPRDVSELALVLDRSALRSTDVREQTPLGSDGARTLLALAGNWRHELDGRTVVATEVQQEWQRFSDARSTDFRRAAAGVRFTREHDETLAWYAALNAQAYSPQGGLGNDEPPSPPLPRQGSARIFGALMGVTRALGSEWRVDVGAGPARFTGGSDKTDWQGALKLEYSRERLAASLDLGRNPGVNHEFGGLAATDEARLRLTYQLGPASQVEVGLGHARERDAGSSRSLASVVWMRQWSPAWQVIVKASAHRQERFEGAATSHRVGVALVYTAASL